MLEVRWELKPETLMDGSEVFDVVGKELVDVAPEHDVVGGLMVTTGREVVIHTRTLDHALDVLEQMEKLDCAIEGISPGLLGVLAEEVKRSPDERSCVQNTAHG